MREIQPVVPCFLQLPYHLASNSLARSLSLFLSFFRSFFLSFSLSLSDSVVFVAKFCGNFPSSDNLSDNHVLHSVPWPSHRAISITLERTCTMKGKCCKWKEDEWTWIHIGMKWKEYERKMKGNEGYIMNTNERNIKGEWEENDRKWMQNERNACKWKENEGKCMQMNAKWKEH